MDADASSSSEEDEDIEGLAVEDADGADEEWGVGAMAANPSEAVPLVRHPEAPAFARRGDMLGGVLEGLGSCLQMFLSRAARDELLSCHNSIHAAISVLAGKYSYMVYSCFAS